MADVKISALPAATSISNTDVAPVVTGGVTKKASAQVIVNSALAASTAGTNPALIGPASSANATRFPNALSVVSNTAAGIQQNESHNIGIMAEGTADAVNTAIYGVGVYGVGYTNAATRSGGVIGEGHVSASTDSGSAIGVRGYSTDTHSGGLNIGVFGNASGAVTGNYSFYSNVAAATNTYSLYMEGTADNYMAGRLGMGSVPYAGCNLNVSKNITGSPSSFGVASNGTVQSDVTSTGGGYSTSLSTAAASFTLGDLRHFNAAQGTIGSGSTVNNQFGFFATPSLTGATNNFGFYGAIAAGTGRFNLYMGGTADNWFNGNVLIGGAGGLGYTIGSGGAVTQITSRTTGVTLNKTNGSITLVSAAGLATYQSFTVTNSTVAATDTIIINQKSGTDKYIIMVTAVAAGSFTITFATTGGATTEQPIFNFSVIKAVTA